MKTLLNQYEMESPSQYFDMVRESKLNGQHTQAKEQFKAMPLSFQKQMVEELSQEDHEEFMFFFRLL
jgi:hypothetical protein